jgi:ATP-dependent RNA helicase RhlE
MYNGNRYRPRTERRGNNRTQQNQIRGQKRPQRSMDVSLLVKQATNEIEPVYVPQHTFADFPLQDQLKQAVLSRGYSIPTPIQDQAIMPLLQGRDVVGIANTGTGKTAAFLIPLINKILLDRTQKTLIIAPTRELAVQIEEEFRLLTQGMQLYSVLCIGGVNINPQIRQLARRPQFVIGTPGRLKDLEKQRKLFLADYRNIVLDEVDRMLDMGFINDMRYIIGKLPTPRQSLFFSATMPESAKQIMKEFLHDPITVTVRTRDTAKNVDQDVVRTNGLAKVDVLHDLLAQDGFDKVLVFGRTKWGMEKLARVLEQRGFRVASIHGNKNQNQRQRAINMFKSNEIQVLLATDIASRGLDIPNVTHVINYDLPETYEDYIHRIGRTGRAENKGTALTILEH